MACNMCIIDEYIWYLVVSFIEDLFDLQMVPGVHHKWLRGSDEVAVVADLRGHLQ